MKAKYGFVALVDALGTRTGTIESSMRYLKAIDEIKGPIQTTHSATVGTKGINRKLFNDLSIRFFGDTILITYQVKNRALENQYFRDLAFILRVFFCYALDMGLFFRGSLSIGEYVENKDVVLGPAVFDAAAWYEKLDMAGIVTTPQATAVLKSILLSDSKVGLSSPVVWMSAVLDIHPIKIPNPIEVFALNWPNVIGVVLNPGETAEACFYRLIRNFSVPLGTESKYQNTERFFLKCYRSKEWKQVPGPGH